jgi:hypothetical protein
MIELFLSIPKDLQVLILAGLVFYVYLTITEERNK